MRYAEIADVVARRIEGGAYPDGEPLPSETALAREFAVARGTIRRALEEVESDRLLSRRGSRWLAHRADRQQSFDVLRSFGQWALATGMRPSGLTVELSRGLATGTEAHELGLRRRAPVLRIVRVMSLDDRPAMIKRTTFPDWLADIIAGIPRDARSIMEVVEGVHGVSLGHAEHHISALPAGAHDARLLCVARAAPLLRVVRTARAADGRAFEYSDDRYASDAVTFSIMNTSRHERTLLAGRR